MTVCSAGEESNQGQRRLGGAGVHVMLANGVAHHVYIGDNGGEQDGEAGVGKGVMQP